MHESLESHKDPDTAPSRPVLSDTAVDVISGWIL